MDLPKTTKNLYPILVSIAFALAIKSLVESFNLAVLLRFVGLVVTLVLFYQAQVGLVQKNRCKTLNLDKWYSQLLYFYLDLGVIGCFVVQSILLEKCNPFLWAFLATIVIDALLELYSIKSPSSSEDLKAKKEQKDSRVYLVLDGCYVALISALFIMPLDDLYKSVCFMVGAVAIAFADYYLFRNNYGLTRLENNGVTS